MQQYQFAGQQQHHGGPPEQWHTTSDLLRLLTADGRPVNELAAAVTRRFGDGEESQAWLARTLVTLLRDGLLFNEVEKVNAAYLLRFAAPNIPGAREALLRLSMPDSGEPPAVRAWAARLAAAPTHQLPQQQQEGYYRHQQHAADDGCTSSTHPPPAPTWQQQQHSAYDSGVAQQHPAPTSPVTSLLHQQSPRQVLSEAGAAPQLPESQTHMYGLPFGQMAPPLRWQTTASEAAAATPLPQAAAAPGSSREAAAPQLVLPWVQQHQLQEQEMLLPRQQYQRELALAQQHRREQAQELLQQQYQRELAQQQYPRELAQQNQQDEEEQQLQRHQGDLHQQQQRQKLHQEQQQQQRQQLHQDQQRLIAKEQEQRRQEQEQAERQVLQQRQEQAERQLLQQRWEQEERQLLQQRQEQAQRQLLQQRQEQEERQLLQQRQRAVEQQQQEQQQDSLLALLHQATQAPLVPSMQQQLIEALSGPLAAALTAPLLEAVYGGGSSAGAGSSSGSGSGGASLQPEHMRGLVEHNSTVASELLLALTEHHPHVAAVYAAAVAELPMSAQSVECLSAVVRTAQLPDWVLTTFLGNCMQDTNACQDGGRQSRHVKLLCACVTLVLQRQPAALGESLPELLAFCIQQSRYKQASELYRQLRDLE